MATLVRHDLVADDEIDYAEVEALCPSGDQWLCRILIRRPREAEWSAILEGQPVHPGDALRVVCVDTRDPAALEALNLRFSAHFYPRLAPRPWPDEQEVIEALLPAAGASVLEVCCGAGRVTPALARDGNRVLGLDVSAACLAAARARHPSLAWVAGDAAALPLRDRAVDVSTCFGNSLGVLFRGPGAALAELLRVARDRVIVGFRDAPCARRDRMHTYYTGAGEVEVARTFDGDAAEALVEALPPAARTRIAHRSLHVGGPRPYGGAAFHLALHLRGAG